MLTYQQFLDKYTGSKEKVNNPDKPAGTAWTTEEIAAKEGMTVEQIRAYGEYYHSVGNTNPPPDFTPKPVVPPVTPPTPPVVDHTGMEPVDPFGNVWRPKRLLDLNADELYKLMVKAVREALQ